MWLVPTYFGVDSHKKRSQRCGRNEDFQLSKLKLDLMACNAASHGFAERWQRALAWQSELRPRGLSCDAFGLSTAAVGWEASLALGFPNVVIATSGRASQWEGAMNQLVEMRWRGMRGDEVTGGLRDHGAWK